MTVDEAATLIAAKVEDWMLIGMGKAIEFPWIGDVSFAKRIASKLTDLGYAATASRTRCWCAAHGKYELSLPKILVLRSGRRMS